MNKQKNDSNMKFDVCFSLGHGCRVAYQLTRNFLRTFSSPLDWVVVNDLETVLHLFSTEFRDFFEQIEDDGIEGNHRRVKDVKNDILAPHFWEIDETIEEGQKRVRGKMRERFIRLNNAIHNANRVLLVAQCYPISVMETFLIRFAEIYPKQELTLINVHSSDDKVDFEKTEIQISDKLKLIQYVFEDTNTCKPWIGNEENWRRALSEYELTAPPYVSELKKWCEESGSILVYGAGSDAKELTSHLIKYGVRVNYIVVTSKENNPQEVNGISVQEIDAYTGLKEKTLVIINVRNVEKRNFIYKQLIDNHFRKIIIFDCYRAEFREGIDDVF